MKRWNNDGFTMIEMLLSFSIFCLIATLIPLFFRIILDDYSLEGRIQWMEWEVFVNQLHKEIKLSDRVEIVNKDLKIWIDDEIVTVQKYNDVLRRRVNMTGHEVILQNVQSVQFTKGEDFVQIEVTDTFGRTNKRKLYSFTGWEFD